MSTTAVPTDVNLPKVEIHATDVCNNRCGFCTTGWVNHEKSDQLVHPAREIIRAQLEDAYRRGARRALFQGGEPTVRRDLGDLLGDAHALGYQATTVFTNARMAASRAGAAWMAAMNVTWFQVSIQGGTAEAHDASVGAKGAWEQTVAGTRRLLALGQRVKVNGVLTRHLLDTLPEFAKLIVDLRPEEIGMDTIKPSKAFDVGFENYANLCPPYSRYSTALADALHAMNGAGVVARLTSFPPCLVPGAEEFIAEEARTTISQDHKGKLFDKHMWKRDMMVKPETCRACAYDESCGGVYEPYAHANGLLELRPLASRKARPVSVANVPVADVALTRALRALFVRDAAAASSVGVREVTRLADGSHELKCSAPGGGFVVVVEPRSERPAYAKTQRFAVSYRSGVKAAVKAAVDAAGDGSSATSGAADTRVLDAIVKTLQRAESYLAGQAVAAGGAAGAAIGKSPADPTAR